MMRAFVRTACASLLVVVATGCENALEVGNLSDPDINKVFSTPTAIEQTIQTGIQSCHNSVVANGNLMPQLLVLALESYSQLNNFSMGPRGAIPRSPILNYRGSASIFGDFSSLSRGSRLATNAMDALDRLTDAGGTLGSAAQNLRAKSFGFFVVGCNLGWLGMVYDSAGIVGRGMSSDSVPPLSSHVDVMKAALAMLDTAITIANDPAASATGGFPVPNTWLGQANAVSKENYVRILRSYRARFRAGVARTPTERAAVDWDAVIADAENGINFDFMVNSGGTTGWSIGFIGSQMHVDATWSQMTPMYFGMADSTGGYDTWLSQPLSSRGYFLIVTADQRWPQGATRAQQQANSARSTSITFRPYISNRTDQDSPGDPWGTSFYNFQRMRYIRDASATGPFPEFVKAENDLLAAEGYIRKGNVALAAAKIDISRVARGGLPALSGVITSLTDQLPGGARGCVPHVPVGPAFTSTVCGNLMEAMKWEKRMETAFTGYGSWFFNGRGWGDLVAGTPLEYPVPYQEMDARQAAFYNLGGGGSSSAVKGTYGF